MSRESSFSLIREIKTHSVKNQDYELGAIFRDIERDFFTIRRLEPTGGYQTYYYHDEAGSTGGQQIISNFVYSFDEVGFFKSCLEAIHKLDDCVEYKPGTRSKILESIKNELRNNNLNILCV